jgi:error-prone DNA polymerase
MTGDATAGERGQPPGTGSAPRAHAKTPPSGFVELRCRSNFSLLRGASAPEDLVERAAELGAETLGIADRDNLCGVVRFDESCEELGLRPIFGAELTLEDGTVLPLLVENADGWRHLSRLVTEAQAARPKGEAALSLEALERHAGGLFALTGWTEGGVTRDLQSGDEGAARARAGTLAEIFGRDRVFLEVQRHLLEGEEQLLDGMRSLARQTGLPLLATGGVRHARREDRRLQDVLTCIREHCTLSEAGTRLHPNAEFQLRPEAEMRALFEGLPDALRASGELASRCCFRLEDVRYRLPRFAVPAGETPFSYLYRLVHEGAERRYRPMTPRVSKQLAHELDVIERLDFAGYFLIVHDIVCACAERGILCQGRGSAANSAVCYCLGITAVDPIGLDLLFERFLSESRREPPDIDLDIAHVRREEIIQYVYERYGRDHAAMATEYISFRARSAVRDVGKALGLSVEEVNRISKALGGRGQVWDPEGDVPEALEAGAPVAGLRPRVVEDLMTLCSQIDDFPRHLGIHVGGMIISRDPLCEIVPVEPATMPGRTVIQWNKDDAAARGLVKIDLLGLGMLTLLQEAIDLVAAHHGETISLHEIPVDDPKVFELLGKADTVGVFQVESRAQMNTLPRMKPKTFHDLVVEVALIRPGPIQGDMVHPYLRRRHGEEPVVYPHPCLEPILSRTLGVPLFQEQGMKLAAAAGGFTPTEADELRRAMGHSRSSRKMAPIVERLKAGMVERGFTEEARETVLRQVESFSNFGFAESHAASFALLVNASAWFKAHFPVEFYGALFNAQPMGFYSTATIAEDARRHGVEVRTPSVNLSRWDTTVEGPSTKPREGTGMLGRIPKGGNGALRLGLRQVRGLAEGLRPRVEALSARAPFDSLPDFALQSGLPRAVLENLAAADAFSDLGLERRRALWEVGRLATAEEQGPLFAGVDPGPERERPSLREVDDQEGTVLDYRLTGVGFGPHPVSFARPLLEEHGALDALALKTAPTGRTVTSGGLVICRQRPGSAKGTLFITLEDEQGFVNVVVREKVFERHRQLLRTAVMLEVKGRLERVGPVVNVLASRFSPLPTPAAGFKASSHDYR